MNLILREGIIVAVIIVALYLVFYAFENFSGYQPLNCSNLTFSYYGQVNDFSMNISNESNFEVVYIKNTADLPENVSLYVETRNSTGIAVKSPPPFTVLPGKEAYFQYLVSPQAAGVYQLNLEISARYGSCVRDVNLPVKVTVDG
ncbi:MAG: hypothetical protein ACP5TF_00535 [Candidatus Acidifodinimicrobium sp.]